MTERRFLRYSLLGLNLMLLGGVVLFVVHSDPVSTANRDAIASRASAGLPADPLDQLSSADIAVNTAKMVAMAETGGVKSQAESVNTELSAPPVYNSVIAKPQTVATELKSRSDIQSYTAVAGDTVSGIASRFHVTSESIKWSNGLMSDAVTVGAQLTIPPVNGIVYTVKAGDTPDTLAQRYKANKEQIVAYNDAEIGGLKVGEQIIIPNGQQPAPARSTYAASGFSWGTGAVYGFNGYDYGFCTWYVANKRISIGRALPANLGNAATWDDRAARAGITVNKTPSYGTAVVTSQRGAGHVAFVERVQDDGIWVSEMNSRGQRSIEDSTAAGGWNRIDYKFIPMSTAVTYNYIY